VDALQGLFDAVHRGLDLGKFVRLACVVLAQRLKLRKDLLDRFGDGR